MYRLTFSCNILENHDFMEYNRNHIIIEITDSTACSALDAIQTIQTLYEFVVSIISPKN